MKNLCVKLVYLQRLTIHVYLVNFRDVLSVAAATSFAFTSLTAHFLKAFLPASSNNLHHLQTDAFFMGPYKTSYSNKFPLHLNTNFYMIEFDREIHLEGDVLNLQSFVSISIHSSMALQPLLGPGDPLKTPPFFSVF